MSLQLADQPLKTQYGNTEIRILDAAQKIFVNDGHSAFTFRRVAAADELSPSNLTYYFKTKKVLLASLIKRLLEDYLEQYSALLETLFDQSVGKTSELVDELVHWVMMEVAVDEETGRFAREIWSLAIHDEEVCQIVDGFYDDLVESFVDGLAQKRPDLDKTKILELMYLLIMVSEGTLVVFGTRQKRSLSVDHMASVVSRTFCRML